MCRGKIRASQQAADRRPFGGIRDAVAQDGQQGGAAPRGLDRNRAHAPLQLADFGHDAEPELVRLHRNQPAQDLPRHTALAVGSDTVRPGGTMPS